ncbi:tetratricopeptide repeat protein [Cytobacillus spongiae]|uniref:tetratricopeptide repeat protein n=1 Tax=Cytobacillus spongiae TaxID=2901381 RepID=UPI001F23623B|nr:tetratricopeptide repeat protein [Cytobacillus spongiae]UII54629.1 tetratricopeptide repeat protein [Cytobacillus spongiae]
MEKINKIVTLLENGEHEEALNHYRQILDKGSNEERFLLGEELFQYGFLEEAKSLYHTLLKAYPEEGELLVLLAETYMELGEEEQAVLELEKVQEHDPSFPQALLLLADLYQMEGLYEVSEQKLIKAKSMLPEEVIIDFALGELYLEQGRFTDAIKYYEVVLKTENVIAGVNVHQRMADALSAGGAFEEAIAYYETALDDRLEINTLFNYGFTALQAGYNKTAIEKFTMLKEIDHEYHSLYINLAKAYEREEQLEECYEAITSGLKQDDFNKDLYYYAGKIALKLNMEEEAEKHLREALVLDPEFSEAALVLNKLLIKQERFEDVLEIIEMMEAIEEEEPQFLWDAALALQNLEKYSEALNKYQLAYTFFKDQTDFLSDYGYFLFEEGKRSEAIEVFTKLLKDDPSNGEYEDILGRLSEQF